MPANLPSNQPPMPHPRKCPPDKYEYMKNTGKIYYKDCTIPPPPPPPPPIDPCDERREMIKEKDRNKRGVEVCAPEPEPEPEPEPVFCANPECEFAICTDLFKQIVPDKKNDDPPVCRPRKVFPDQPQFVNLTERFDRDHKPDYPKLVYDCPLNTDDEEDEGACSWSMEK